MGEHTVVISSKGYNTYTAVVQVCLHKVSFVNYDRASLAPTTATTTVATTTVPTTTVTTTPVVTTQVSDTTTVPTAAITTVTTNPPTMVQLAGITTQPDILGSLSVTTDPAGAFIFIDGVQRGVSPATIPGLSAGTHTLLLKLDGYRDLSTPVTIAAGRTQAYSSAMVKNAAAPAETLTMEVATTAKKSSAPGFECILALAAMGSVLVLRRLS